MREVIHVADYLANLAPVLPWTDFHAIGLGLKHSTWHLLTPIYNRDSRPFAYDTLRAHGLDLIRLAEHALFSQNQLPPPTPF